MALMIAQDGIHPSDHQLIDFQKAAKTTVCQSNLSGLKLVQQPAEQGAFTLMEGTLREGEQGALAHEKRATNRITGKPQPGFCRLG